MQRIICILLCVVAPDGLRDVAIINAHGPPIPPLTFPMKEACRLIAFSTFVDRLDVIVCMVRRKCWVHHLQRRKDLLLCHS